MCEVQGLSGQQGKRLRNNAGWARRAQISETSKAEFEQDEIGQYYAGDRDACDACVGGSKNECMHRQLRNRQFGKIPRFHIFWVAAFRVYYSDASSSTKIPGRRKGLTPEPKTQQPGLFSLACVSYTVWLLPPPEDAVATLGACAKKEPLAVQESDLGPEPITYLNHKP